MKRNTQNMYGSCHLQRILIHPVCTEGIFHFERVRFRAAMRIKRKSPYTISVSRRVMRAVSLRFPYCLWVRSRDERSIS